MHSIVAIVGGGIGTLFLIGVPLMLYLRIRRFLLFSKMKQHEHSKELEYILGVSEEYDYLYLKHYASFNRRGAFMPVIYCLYKLILWTIFCFLRSRRPYDALQGILYFFIILCFAIYRTYLIPFRIGCTNKLLILVEWTLVFNAVYGRW